ncbi:MAG TPA: DUF4402 domain-containing protein [Prolixibacteraceae bacterium]|nr:DUF4402 domain-containing protein [Prolixibacteraceae bacterium]
MKNVVRIFCGIIICSMVAVTEANAQATATGTATAEIIEALTTREVSPLNFGRFSPETQGGKIILTPDGIRSVQGTVVLAGGTHSSASFYVSGQYEATFTIALPAGPEILTNLQNEKTMVVGEWRSTPAAGIGIGKLVGGATTVYIGATLTVGDMNANPAGMYAGTFTVTFAYN